MSFYEKHYKATTTMKIFLYINAIIGLTAAMFVQKEHGVQLVNFETPAENMDTCAMCKNVCLQVEKQAVVIGQLVTDEIDSLCDKFTKDEFKKLCSTLSSGLTKTIDAILLHTDEICPKIHLCPSNPVAAEFLENDETCDQCKKVSGQASDAISTAVDTAIDTVMNLCAYCPEPDKCSKEGKKIEAKADEAIFSAFDQACTAIHLCH
eukprot:Awhi_evm1s13627